VFSRHFSVNIPLCLQGALCVFHPTPIIPSLKGKSRPCWTFFYLWFVTVPDIPSMFRKYGNWEKLSPGKHHLPCWVSTPGIWE
jgi:hypothetical protein